MTKQRYEAMIACFKGPHKDAWVFCFRYAPYLLAFLYAGLCLFVMFARPAIAVRVIGVPAVVFALSSALRAAINRPRPYDALGFSAAAAPQTRQGQEPAQPPTRPARSSSRAR